jgi:hypothetical protein
VLRISEVDNLGSWTGGVAKWDWERIEQILLGPT